MMILSLMLSVVTMCATATEPSVVELELPLKGYDQTFKFVKKVGRVCTAPSDRIDLSEPPKFAGDAECGREIQSLSQVWKNTKPSQLSAVNILGKDRALLLDSAGLTSATMAPVSACPCVVFTGDQALKSAKTLKRAMAKKRSK